MHLHFHSRLLLVAASFVAAHVSLCAQTVDVPRPAPGAAISPQEYRSFDPTHLKDRPYSGNLPKPQFPSSDRVQRDFVVEYVYDYALSNYTPSVRMPIQTPAQRKRDTPENALIAFYSAMRSGEYEYWFQSWDEPGQKELTDDAKNKKLDAAAWKKLWQQVFAGNRDAILVDRLETQSYVILDVQLPGTDLKRVPTVFKLVQGQWLVTNELSVNPILYLYRPESAGVLNLVPPVPTRDLDQGNPQQAQSQQQFLDQHTQRSRTMQAGH